MLLTEMKPIIDEAPEFISVEAHPQDLRDAATVYINGGLLDIKPSQKVWLKSESFAWGYGGAGPSQLALAILLIHFPEEVAKQFFQDFKFKIVGNWPMMEIVKVKLSFRKIMQEIYQARVGNKLS